MRELEERIVKDGKLFGTDILKVGSFLNQQIDVKLLKNMALETIRLFPKDLNITKVLTIEASGIAFATAIALELGVPVVFAKKSKTSNISGEVVTAEVYSFTHNVMNQIIVPKDYIEESDRVLIADDFLAKGNALQGLIDLVEKSNASVIGCVVQIEKEYQDGGNDLRGKGYRVESLARIKEIKDGKIMFS